MGDTAGDELEERSKKLRRYESAVERMSRRSLSSEDLPSDNRCMATWRAALSDVGRSRSGDSLCSRDRFAANMSRRLRWELYRGGGSYWAGLFAAASLSDCDW
jgi:hypothetical protein